MIQNFKYKKKYHDLKLKLIGGNMSPSGWSLLCCKETNKTFLVYDIYRWATNGNIQYRFKNRDGVIEILTDATLLKTHQPAEWKFMMCRVTSETIIKTFGGESWYQLYPFSQEEIVERLSGINVSVVAVETIQDVNSIIERYEQARPTPDTDALLAIGRP